MQETLDGFTYNAADNKQLNLYQCIEDVARCPAKASIRLQRIKEIVDKYVCDDGVLYKGEEINKRCGETVLHTAIKLFRFNSNEEKEIVELLISKFPKLLLQDRGTTDFAGQTPLHMGVCKGNIWLVSTLMKQLSKKNTRHWKDTLLKRKANGPMFANTVMMGELPLSIAALTFNKGMFDLLLTEGSDIDGTNHYGDNLCHSLIKYGYLYPEKMGDVLEMCKKINEDIAPYDNTPKATKNRKLRKKIWLMENNEGMNPLQLSAKLGFPQMFFFIMELESYCSDNSKDGLFDIRVYDITEIDAISSMTTEEIRGKDGSVDKAMLPQNIPRRPLPKEVHAARRSILMMMFELDPAIAFQFIQFPPVLRIINTKFNAYRIWFYSWMCFHVIFTGFFTWNAIERSQQKHNTLDGLGFDVYNTPKFSQLMFKPSHNFVTAYGIICVIVSFIYITLEIIRNVKGRMLWTLKSFWNPYCNGWFRIMFLLQSFCLIIDFFASIFSNYYENYLLIVAIIISWFLMIFFLRAVRPFSFFTVLIQKVLIGDMFRFFVILGLEIMAFSTAMYIAIQGSDVINDQDYSNYGRVIFSMFKLMVGLGEIAQLYNTRHPALCIIIFVGFIVMTTLLIVNALIAMMSYTCTELVENVGTGRDRHFKLQRLSVILFLESVFPRCLIHKVGKIEEVFRYNNAIHRRKSMKRYMLEIRSVMKESNEDDETVTPNSWGFKTLVFNALRNRQTSQSERPTSGVSAKLRQVFQRKPKNAAVIDLQERQEQRHFQLIPQVRAKTPIVAETNLAHGLCRNGQHLRSAPEILDIYHLTHCRNCSKSDLSRDV